MGAFWGSEQTKFTQNAIDKARAHPSNAGRGGDPVGSNPNPGPRGGNTRGKTPAPTPTPKDEKKKHFARGGGGAESIGKAQPRDSVIGGSDTLLDAAPNMMRDSSAATAAALAAAVRARRKGAGSSVLTGLSAGTGAPRAMLQRLTLRGLR
jgi:hypothetical protein